MPRTNAFPRYLCLAMLAALVGCTSNRPSTAESTTFNKSTQAAITPDQAMARLAEGNRRFVTGNSLHRDYPAQVLATATGQYPFAVILSCIDSRSGPEIVFDQGIGDLFVARVAGNYCPVDLLGSMEFATKVAGARLVVVLGHTECGAIKGAIDNVELGNLTTVIRALKPAVSAVSDAGDDRTSKNKKFVLAVTEANVHRTVAAIRRNSPILRELEESGRIKIVGAILDVHTGEVTFLR